VSAGDGGGRLAGAVALVTGAASGIGRAIAIVFAAQGAHVVLADVRRTPREGGVPTLDLIARAGGSVYEQPTDVRDEAQVADAVAVAVERFGALDVMVNDAAIGDSPPLLETSVDVWDEVLAVNLRGVFLGCREAVRVMRAQEPGPDGVRGRIVNIASQHGMVAAPGSLAYGVSKAGVAYLTRQVAVDYAADGIVCNAVAPGKIVTGKPGPAADAQVLAAAQARTPWPRLGRPDDVAGAVLWLASAESSFVTGEVVMVDGGWMAA
jgi:NAD(P)-dependent dehydrogenase (short-subunit alcohol dehydrogenase family)